MKITLRTLARRPRRDTMDSMRTRHAKALLREVDQLDAALARLEHGLTELTADTAANVELLTRVRLGVPATADVHRLPVFAGETRRHDRRLHTA